MFDFWKKNGHEVLTILGSDSSKVEVMTFFGSTHGDLWSMAGRSDGRTVLQRGRGSPLLPPANWPPLPPSDSPEIIPFWKDITGDTTFTHRYIFPKWNYLWGV